MFVTRFRFADSKGMTLPEILVAVALTSLVMASAFQGYAMIVAAKNGSSAQVNALKFKSMIILETAKPADCKSVLGNQTIIPTLGTANPLYLQNLGNPGVIDFNSVPNATYPNNYHEWVVSSINANVVGIGTTSQLQLQTYTNVLVHLAFVLTAKTSLPGMAAGSTLLNSVPLVLVLNSSNQIASCSSQQSSLGKTQLLPKCNPGEILLYGGASASTQPTWWCNSVNL